MTLRHLECLVLLRAHRELWDAVTLQRIMNKEAVDRIASGNISAETVITVLDGEPDPTSVEECAIGASEIGQTSAECQTDSK